MNTPTSAVFPELTEEMRRQILLADQVKKLSTPIFSKRNVGIFFASILFLFGQAWYLNRDEIAEHHIILFYLFLIAGGSVLLTVAVTIPIRSFWRAKLERDLLSAGLRLRSEELQEKLDENFFTNLVKINFKYIDKYYLQTQVQANKSFALAAVAASFSLLVIISGILMLFFKPEKVEPGYVATASGVLGEFIAAVFFYLYNRTITKMGEYHEKLVLTQNIGLSLRITEDLPLPEKTAAQLKLVECLCQDINLYLTGNAPEGISRKKGRRSDEPKALSDV